MARQEYFTIQQYGIESVHGTAVAATAMRVGVAPRIITDSRPEFIVEQFNTRMESRRAHIYERLYQNTLSTPHAGFQQLLLPFLTGLVGGVSAAEQTVDQGDYLWDFTPDLTPGGANDPDSFTLQVGDDEKAWRIPYCMTDRITISGSVAQDGGAAPVALEQSFFGRFIEENAFTSALDLEPSTPMNAKLAQLWVDNAWEDVGNTEVSDALVDFQIEILTGLHPIFRGGTQIYFNSHREGIIGYTATFTVDTALRDELFAKQRAAALQVVQFKITGPQIGSGDPHALVVNMGGMWEDVTPRDNSDRGDNLSTLALHGVYDDTGATGLEVYLTTDLGTI